jgi:DNA-binding winged helix-turn-helix (wHTH) protein/predicted Zn-dependent protease
MVKSAGQDFEDYRFGPFALSVSRRELRRGKALVPLADKAFDLLATLVRAAGRTVTRTELIDALWPDTRVEESNLTQTMFLLRKALEEDVEGAGYIRTVRGQGYTFVASVSTNGAEVENAPAWRPQVWGRYAAVALLVAAGVFWWSRTRNPPLTDQDVLVLADFTNMTSDPAFDNVMRDVLAYQLEQSPFLKVLDDGVLRDDLQRMRRSQQEHITNELARDICIREADKAMLAGSITSFGKSYAIDLKATHCQSGKTLAREHAEATDKEHILAALTKAARSMRAKLGESLSSIEKLAPPLKSWNVTTSSLEAFQAFHEGATLYVRGSYSEALPPLTRATELDPNLAFAWWFLAGAYYNAGGTAEKYHEYLKRAWALGDRVSAYERMRILIDRDDQTMEEAVQNAEEFARLFPRNPGARTVLGRIHQTAGDYEKALSDFQEVYRLYKQSYRPMAIEVIGLVMSYAQLDRFDEAKAVAQEMFSRGGDGLGLRPQLLWIAYAQDDQAAAARQIALFSGKPDEHQIVAREAAEARTRGELRKSRELLQRAADLARMRNLPDSVITYLKPESAGDALVGNCATARKMDEAADPSLDRVNLATIIPVNRIGDAILALCGTPSLAEKAEERNKKWISGEYRSPAKVPVTRAAIAFGLGDPQRAIELLEAAKQYERGYPMANYIRGLAYLKLKRGADAAAEFQKVLDHRGANWGPLYPLSYVGLARGAALTGETARARRAYEQFFDLWKDADVDVPILVQARKEYGRAIKN